MRKSIIIAFMAFAAMFAAISCSNSGSLKKDKCTVTFNLKGGSSEFIEEKVEVKYGDTVDEPNAPPTAPQDKYYEFDHWSKEGTDEKTAYNFSEKVTSDITLNAVYKERYTIGGRGPAYGFIVYENTSYDPKSTEDDKKWKYLEVASTDFSVVINSSNTFTPPWGNTSTSVGTETTLGKGRSNTKKMKESNNLNSQVAEAIWGKTWNGLTDWFIPSKDELTAIRTAVGNNTEAHISNGDYYWSSSEDGNSSAWRLKIGDSTAGAESCSRDSQNRVRLVRAF